MNVQYRFCSQSFVFIFALIHGDHYFEKDNHNTVKSLELTISDDAEEFEKSVEKFGEALDHIKDEIKDDVPLNDSIKPDLYDISNAWITINSGESSSGENTEIKPLR